MTFDKWFDTYHFNASQEARTVARRVWNVKEKEKAEMREGIERILHRLENRTYPQMWKAWIMTGLEKIRRGSE